MKTNYNSRQRKIYSDYNEFPSDTLFKVKNSDKYLNEVISIIDDILKERGDLQDFIPKKKKESGKKKQAYINSDDEYIDLSDNNGIKFYDNEWEKLKDNFVFQIIAGVCLFILGLTVTIVTFKDENDGAVIWYGAMLVGIIMFITGLKKA